jgi:hypothetical protein
MAAPTTEGLMNEVLAEMRAQLAHSGFRLGRVAVKLEMDDSILSRVLNGSRPLPEDLPGRFDQAIRDLAREEAERLLGIANEAEVVA